MKKIIAFILGIMLLAAQSVAWAADNENVRTVMKEEKKVAVEAPLVIKGSTAVNAQINAQLTKAVNEYINATAGLGGGKVHYELHKCDASLISFTLIMTPKQGVEETKGLTFDRSTGALRPLSFYYKDEEVLNRAADGLKYLYDVAPAKVKTAPDEYYVDSDGNIIGIYHAGAVLDKSEGEIEVNLSAADPVIVKEPVTPPPAYTGDGNKGTITGTEVRMRGGPSTDSDILGYFDKGEVVQVLQSDITNGMKWYKVTRTSGVTGWVAADYCSVGNEAKVEKASTTEKKVRLWARK